MSNQEAIIDILRQRFAALDAPSTSKEGNVSWGGWRGYVAALSQLDRPIRTILEIGFNAGHSCAMLCELFPEARVVSVDVPGNPACKPAKALIDQFYFGRHELLLEDSRTALPKLSGQFDLIFIDGNHDAGFPQQDMYNCQRLARPDTIVVLDDAYGDQSYSVEPHKTLAAFKTLGAFEELGSWVSDDKRFGLSYGTFVKPVGNLDYVVPPLPPMSLSVLIGCYGNYPQYSLRAVRSALSSRRNYSIHVGCSACCDQTVAELEKLFATGEIDSLILSRQNINKDPMMRLLVDRADTDYVLWLDDDSHFTDPSWSAHLQAFIGSHKFDVAGHVHFFHPDDTYRKFRDARPWWRGEAHFLEPDHAKRTWFPTGGLFLARADYLREHNFPDRLMIKKMDDILLGDLVSQTHGKLINFSGAFMRTIKISDGNRRGEGELASDWRFHA